MNPVLPTQGVTARKVVYRTRGSSHGPIARLMSPSDLGERLKPFVFLDRFEADLNALSGSMPLHPHSGIATVTVFTSGDATFDDPQAGHGTLGYGGVEFVRAGSGVWHGKELSGGTSPTVQGFQLWLALPPDLENAPPDAQYSPSTPSVGPARLILGEYAGAKSPVSAPSGISYLVVTLQPGERWTYQPPQGHDVAWVAIGRGALSAGEAIANGELAIFEPGASPITFEGAGSTATTFVLGSAVPHRHELHLGSHSVHTSASALATGERNIREIKRALDASRDRRSGTGSIPVFRG
jgi:redox-sensitive bicupin YhaK (pirin superfamily)